MKPHHLFIPTRKNKFHPLALRPVGLMVFAAIFFTIPIIYNVTTAKKFQVLGYATNINVSDLNVYTNQQRTANGLPSLNIDQQLISAANAKAADMFADNYWAHVAPDGITPWSFILSSGYDYSAAGENLAKDFNTSSGVVNAWMNSSEHRANILNSDYKDVGYAVVNGTLLGQQTTLVVAMYSARVAASTIAASSPEAQATTIETTSKASSTQVATETKTTNNTQTASSGQSDSVVATTNGNQSTVTNTKNDTTSKTDYAGEVKGAAALLPVKIYSSMNWGQKTSVMLICVLILLFVMKHTLIWREQKRGLRHIWLRSHPISQGMILTIALIFTIASGVGIVL